MRSSPTEAAASSSRKRRSHLDDVLTERYLRREYVEHGRSSAALAGEVGCDHKTILRYLGLFGISRRRRGWRSPRYPELRSVAYLRDCLEAGSSASDIAARLGCSRSAAAAALRAAGLAQRGRLVFAASLSEGYLRQAYVRDRRSLADIAAEVGCGPSTVARYLRRHHLPARPPGGRRPGGA